MHTASSMLLAASQCTPPSDEASSSIVGNTTHPSDIHWPHVPLQHVVQANPAFFFPSDTAEDGAANSNDGLLRWVVMIEVLEFPIEWAMLMALLCVLPTRSALPAFRGYDQFQREKTGSPKEKKALLKTIIQTSSEREGIVSWQLYLKNCEIFSLLSSFGGARDELLGNNEKIRVAKSRSTWFSYSARNLSSFADLSRTMKLSQVDSARACELTCALFPSTRQLEVSSWRKKVVDAFVAAAYPFAVEVTNPALVVTFAASSVEAL
ncbi:hypothetical protein GQ600_24540 [Phytophthora cactorum]|nr:hypothetical protein GQ600_24540 [Phytophthora cactorum]